MKVLFSIIFIFLFTNSISVLAQVGININNPQGVFHIDPQSNSSSITTDDVIFTKDGFLGIGTTNPTAQVHIESKSINPLQIVDGDEAVNRVLLSDSYGRGHWGTMRGTGGLQIMFPAATYNKGVNSFLPIGTGLDTGDANVYKATGAGNYLIFLRMWGQTSAATDYQAGFSVYLYRNGSVVDRTQMYVPVTSSSGFVTFTVILAAPNTSAGDVLKMAVTPLTGNYTLRGTDNHTASKVTVFMM